MVTANDALSAAAQVSASDRVIQGKDGWLYYKDSLDDYQKTNLLSDRSIFNIAHTMKMVQDNLQGRGIDFVFTVAPNKNTIYPEHMPYYLPQIAGEGNLERLGAALDEEGVNYLDAEEILKDEKGQLQESGPTVGSLPLYHRMDSHWNNYAASLIAKGIGSTEGMDPSEKEETQKVKWELRKDFKGDLATMLYPEWTPVEEELYPDAPQTFTYDEAFASTFDPKITAENPEGQGSLIMYRDSFGNALVPLLSERYEASYYSRGVPNQMETDLWMHEADVIAVERAERFLPDLAQSPPVLDAWVSIYDGTMDDPDVETEEAAEDVCSDFSAQLTGSSWEITGRLDETVLPGKERIWILADGQFLYEAYPTTEGEGKAEDPYGFTAYIQEDFLAEGMKLEVLVGQDESDMKSVFFTVL